MGLDVLLYFVKYPTPGKVKTRLAKTLGDQAAARLYRDLAEKNLKVITPLFQQKMYNFVIVFDPPEREEAFKKWLSLPCPYLPQASGDLGQRLIHAFRTAFDKGGQRVIAIGSDTLGLTSDIIEKGFECLKSEDVIIGPAQDGGYYLIGLSHFQPQLFEGIPWSTSEVLPQTYKAISHLRLSYQTLCPLEDLDEIKAAPRESSRGRGKKYEHIFT